MEKKIKFKLECNNTGAIEITVKNPMLGLDIKKSFLCPNNDALQFNKMLRKIKNGDLLFIKKVKKSDMIK